MKRFGTIRLRFVLLMLLVVAAVMIGGLLLRWLSAGKPDKSVDLPQAGRDLPLPAIRLFKHVWGTQIKNGYYGIAQNRDGSFVIFVGSNVIQPAASIRFGHETVTITILVIGAGMVYLGISFLRRKQALQEELSTQPYAPP